MVFGNNADTARDFATFWDNCEDMSDSDKIELQDDRSDVISNEAVKEMNQELIQKLVTGLLNEPEVDLISLIPQNYGTQMRGRSEFSTEKSRKTELTKLNEHWFRVLLSRYLEDPTTNIVDNNDPKSYNQQRQGELAKPKSPVISKTKTKRKVKKRKFYASIDESKVTSFDIIQPLSREVKDMLQLDGTTDASEISVEKLKHAIRQSKVLFRCCGTFVAKLNERLAVKVEPTKPSNDTNHCLALQFIAEHAPEVSAPRLHGLIRLDVWSMMFMSYIPGSSLTKVWPTIPSDQRVVIQAQLDDAFTEVRQIKRDGRQLGLLDGSGVVDVRPIHELFETDKPLYTVAEFEDFIFSYRPWVKNNYIQFLKRLLPASRLEEECVFTHCEVRTDNIMVDTGENGDWRVTGIVDWEEAGFYPAYWESVKTTRCFLANQDDDWYLSLPPCIAPSTYPRAWLVDRLWWEMVQYLSYLRMPSKERKT